MLEIKPDLSDQSRCISVHWSLPVQCVLPCSHREIWHEAWHPGTGNRIRYRRSMGIYATEELHDGGWNELWIPTPGEVCGEPHTSTPGVFCQYPRTHNEVSWRHRATVDGCMHTWSSVRREPTPDQVAIDLQRVRQQAATALAEVRQLTEDRDRAVRERDSLVRRLNARYGELSQARAERDEVKDTLDATMLRFEEYIEEHTARGGCQPVDEDGAGC